MEKTGKPLEAEDYENILKASAEDINNDGYDIFTGFGHVQADAAYQLIYSRQYKITHLDDIVGTQVYGDWSPLENTYFDHEVIFNGQIQSGAYQAKKRIVSTTIDLNQYGSFDFSSPLYVWGRGGQKISGGYSASNPNLQERYTEVVSGHNGHTGTGVLYPVYGIEHSYSPNCVLRTYQFMVYSNGVLLGVYPPNESIKYSLSVFSGPKSTSVSGEETISYCNNNVIVNPSPADNSVTISYRANNCDCAYIEIVDLMGRSVASSVVNCSSIGWQKYTCRTAEYENGMYLIRIQTSEGAFTKEFVVIH